MELQHGSLVCFLFEQLEVAHASSLLFLDWKCLSMSPMTRQCLEISPKLREFFIVEVRTWSLLLIFKTDVHHTNAAILIRGLIFFVATAWILKFVCFGPPTSGIGVTPPIGWLDLSHMPSTRLRVGNWGIFKIPNCNELHTANIIPSMGTHTYSSIPSCTQKWQCK